MAKINKLICDKCNKELMTDYYKMTIEHGNRDNEYCPVFYLKEGRIDLCSDCYKKFKNFLGEK